MQEPYFDTQISRDKPVVPAEWIRAALKPYEGKVRHGDRIVVAVRVRSLRYDAHPKANPWDRDGADADLVMLWRLGPDGAGVWTIEKNGDRIIMAF